MPITGRKGSDTKDGNDLVHKKYCTYGMVGKKLIYSYLNVIFKHLEQS